VVYSNDPSSIYWVTGREPVHWLTGGIAEEQGIAPSSAEFVEQLEDDSTCGRRSFLAWFGSDDPPPDIQDRLEKRARLMPIARVADGTLYRMRVNRSAVTAHNTARRCSD
jgi:hypothetical protein